MRLFFTLYILSIFTHEMYMIGMHIIFLLTNSFNKALSICCSRLSFHWFYTRSFQSLVRGVYRTDEGRSWLASCSQPPGGNSEQDRNPFKIKQDKVSFSSLFFIKIESSWLNICVEQFNILVNPKHLNENLKK